MGAAPESPSKSAGPIPIAKLRNIVRENHQLVSRGREAVKAPIQNAPVRPLRTVQGDDPCSGLARRWFAARVAIIRVRCRIGL